MALAACIVYTLQARSWGLWYRRTHRFVEGSNPMCAWAADATVALPPW